jgi:hypothetical protein
MEAGESRTSRKDAARTDDLFMITEIHPRKNYIIRKSIKLSRQVQVLAANIDQAFVIATPVMPRTSPGFIDRFLATAEAYNIPAGIIFNKSDLYDDETHDWVKRAGEIYSSIGYEVLVTSALMDQQPDELKEKAEGQSIAILRTFGCRQKLTDQCTGTGTRSEDSIHFFTASERHAYDNVRGNARTSRWRNDHRHTWHQGIRYH